MKITVEPVFGCTMEQMWHQVRRAARRTVHKRDVDSVVSDDFKRKMLSSEHSPIRELRFWIDFDGLPTWEAQQISRHRVSTDLADFWLHEDVDPTDVEFYVGTQRVDRTGLRRGSQEAPVDFSICVNMAGLISMSQKRLCLLASRETYQTWRDVVRQITALDPACGAALVPSCIYRGRCFEAHKCACKLDEKPAFNVLRNKYEKELLG